jgi:hypothetical protein
VTNAETFLFETYLAPVSSVCSASPASQPASPNEVRLAWVLFGAMRLSKKSPLAGDGRPCNWTQTSSLGPCALFSVLMGDKGQSKGDFLALLVPYSNTQCCMVRGLQGVFNGRAMAMGRCNERKRVPDVTHPAAFPCTSRISSPLLAGGLSIALPSMLLRRAVLPRRGRLVVPMLRSCCLSNGVFSGPISWMPYWIGAFAYSMAIKVQAGLDLRDVSGGETGRFNKRDFPKHGFRDVQMF